MAVNVVIGDTGAIASQNLYFLQVIDVSGLVEIHLCYYEFLLLVNAIDGAETHFPW